MEGSYDVLESGRKAGVCRVQREGLYWRFSCQCTLGDSQIGRLMLRIGDFEKNLGVLMPSEAGFSLTCREAARNIPAGTPEFSVVLRQKQGIFAPVYPEEPFAYITRLEHAYLERRNGQIGVVIK